MSEQSGALGAGRRRIDWILLGRVAFAITGLAGLAYGILRLLSQVPPANLLLLAIWLIVAVIVHDLLIAPGTVAAGWLLRRTVPDRERRYLQAFLIIAGLITVVALPMIYRQGTEPAQKALLVQDYRISLAILVGGTALVTIAFYLIRRGRQSRA